MNKQELILEIQRLKKEKNAIILAHYYSDPDVQDIADYLGDSLGLSKTAATSNADIIVFCGVHFMAETAAVLCPNKKILIPDPTAGCSLADGATRAQLKEWRKQNPNGQIISYVNTSAEVKAESDLCCTSANAEKMVESLPTDKPLLFAPDIHLGGYIKALREKEGISNIKLWDGHCDVHEKITLKVVQDKMMQYPNTDVLLHPEAACSSEKEIMDNPLCFMYSTSGIIKHVAKSDKTKFLIGTEIGTLHELKKQNPDKEFIPVVEDAICEHMRKTTLDKLYQCLLTEQYQVTVPKEIADEAILPIQKMMDRS